MGFFAVSIASLRSCPGLIPWNDSGADLLIINIPNCLKSHDAMICPSKRIFHMDTCQNHAYLPHGFGLRPDLLWFPQSLHFLLWFTKTHAHVSPGNSSSLTHTTKHLYNCVQRVLMNGFADFILCWGNCIQLLHSSRFFKLSGQEVCVKHLLSQYLHVYFWKQSGRIH